MRLVGFTKISPLTRQQATFFRPEVRSSSTFDGEITSVECEGTIRKVATAILRQVVHFSVEPNPLDAFYLCHDCSVFGVACQTGETFKDEPFFDESDPDARCVVREWRKSEIVRLDESNTIPHPLIGGALMTMQLNGYPSGSHHVMVRASEEDGREPLYASKLGIFGAAVIHTIPEVIQYYPSDAIVPVRLAVVNSQSLRYFE